MVSGRKPWLPAFIVLLSTVQLCTSARFLLRRGYAVLTSIPQASQLAPRSRSSFSTMSLSAFLSSLTEAWFYVLFSKLAPSLTPQRLTVATWLVTARFAICTPSCSPLSFLRQCYRRSHYLLARLLPQEGNRRSQAHEDVRRSSALFQFRSLTRSPQSRRQDPQERNRD